MKKNGNPFSPDDADVPNFPRNSYDLSNLELFTAQFGQLIPVNTTEVHAGTTLRFNSMSVGVRGMPTAFPIQTPIKGRLSLFYVRNRTLWSDWEDFIFKTKDNLVHPFLSLSESRASEIGTGSLADCFGLATTKGVYGSSQISVYPNSYLNSELGSENGPFLTYGASSQPTVQFIVELMSGAYTPARGNYFAYSSTPPSSRFYSIFTRYLSDVVTSISVNCNSVVSSTPPQFVVTVFSKTNLVYQDKNPYVGVGVSAAITPSLRTADSSSTLTFTLPDTLVNAMTSYGTYCIAISLNAPSAVFFRVGTQIDSAFNWSIMSAGMVGVNLDDVPAPSNPYVKHGSAPVPPVRISALPFRAYEMICNYYYRNDLNNPVVYNGVTEYNKFIPSTDGGPDFYHYDYHYHNLELDPYTSAVQSPQFGAAPLVGLEYNVGVPHDYVELLFKDSNDHEYKATMAVDPDTDHVLSIVKFDDDIPSANLRGLTDMVDAGFSINTLRNVNAFQRFKENTIRRGLRYRNQMKSHAGVVVDYPDIDVPQYLGGVSATLGVGQINNTSDSGSVGLGDYVGTLGGSISLQHSIQCYCPEHGFVMAIFSISPTPVYSQTTPKFLTRQNAFDYYQQEFGKIGYVPITYSEVSPLEVGFSELQNVFGYQRAFYEYMSKQDRIHGDFKKTLLDFTLARLYTGAPLLGRQFTQVNPDDYNHVFLDRNIATEYSSDAKFLISVHTDMDALQSIPRHGVPSLE